MVKFHADQVWFRTAKLDYQEDGSVVIPAVLRPYMGGVERISPPN